MNRSNKQSILPAGSWGSQRSGPRYRGIPTLLPVLAITLAALLGSGSTCSRLASPAQKERSAERLEEAVRLRALALAEMENERYQNAVVHLESLAKTLPDNILPPINLAICYSRLNRPADALRQVEIARRLDPDNPSMLFTLARILEQAQGTNEQWLSVVRHFAQAHPEDVRPYYLEARALAQKNDFVRAIPLLQRGLGIERENLVLLGDLLVAAAAASDFDTLIDALNALEDRLDGFEGSLEAFATRLRSSVEQRDDESLKPQAIVFRNLLRPKELYQVHLAPLVGGRRVGGGLFPQLDFEPPLPKSVQGGQDISIRFEDATDSLPPDFVPAISRSVVTQEPDRDAILATRGGRVSMWTGDGFVHRADVTSDRDDIVLLVALDTDERLDLVIADAETGITLYPGSTDGTFGSPSKIVEFAPSPSGASPTRIRGVFPMDIDHDGDLDLFIARDRAPDLYLQNNGDGSWAERAEALGIAGDSIDTSAAAAADFDDDGDLDLLTAHPGSHPRLYLNPRVGPFVDASSPWGLREIGGAEDLRVGDLDNDGRFDLALWGAEGLEPALLLNRQPGFEPMPLPEEAMNSWTAAALADFDNDGDLDLLIATTESEEALLIRNRRSELTAEPTGVSVAGVKRMLVGDFDDDGDLDLVATGMAGGNRLWRNDGGNRNHWLRIILKGRFDNNSKNNVQGLHSRIESRSGGAFQTTLGNGRTNHLGLGAQRQVEVLRVIWTNGLAQLWQLVTSDRTLVEEQMLKGSCPMLYTWNGDSFEFVTDLMWKSPLGMMLANGRPAPHQSARDFVLIPGEAFQRSGSDLWLQVTEELWETIYVDKQRLVAVDHPTTVDLLVDESFRPPPYSREMPLHWIGETVAPEAAKDQLGRDVLDEISRRDGRHVDQLPLTRYQGLTEGHSLTMSFSGLPAKDAMRLRLLLWGWTFPTDTSINFALAQNDSLDPRGPSLELLEPDGTWTTLEPFIGFPNGKRKAMVVDLGGRLPAGRATLRIKTSLQIYWDAAAIATGEPQFAPSITPLAPAAADLHYRGYSRLYRESATGPHLFDYSDVSVGPRFRDMSGTFTRYGPVGELLDSEDDRYVVMNAGDEMTIRYDARTLPELPPDWRRDWVLYTDGWVKDADIHTARSQTVTPLPYHGQRGYPALPEHSYPDDPIHRLYLEQYQTRQVDDAAFREALSARREPIK